MKKDAENIERSGFTLIEMMVVILIIMLLSAMLFKITEMVTGKSSQAKAVADITNLQYALAEYYSEYDMYPATSLTGYEYENAASQSEGLKATLAGRNNPDKKTFITDSEDRVVKDGSDWSWGKSTKGSLGYRYGLVSFLYPRAQGNQSHWYSKDTERDTLAKKRWAHFLKDVRTKHRGIPHDKLGNLEITQSYTNSYLTVIDPWNNEYKYECKPPFHKYKLWSVGPDGKNGTADDINNDAFAE